MKDEQISQLRVYQPSILRQVSNDFAGDQHFCGWFGLSGTDRLDAGNHRDEAMYAVKQRRPGHRTE